MIFKRNSFDMTITTNHGPMPGRPEGSIPRFARLKLLGWLGISCVMAGAFLLLISEDARLGCLMMMGGIGALIAYARGVIGFSQVAV